METSLEFLVMSFLFLLFFIGVGFRGKDEEKVPESPKSLSDDGETQNAWKSFEAEDEATLLRHGDSWIAECPVDQMDDVDLRYGRGDAILSMTPAIIL